jgi:Relaxase/Mobilisation nuclease domain
MISKHIPGNSFYHTCRYICNKPGAVVLVTEGVRGHDYKLMAQDFETQQQLRPSKSQACFHAILSFYPGEKPSDELMQEIAEKYLKALEIENTQYAISKHTDKAHLHLHILANMVNNEGRVISDSWIGLRGKKIAQKLTEEYKLVPAIEKNLKKTNLEALNEMESNKYKIYVAIAENLPKCRTLEELETSLLKLGIETKYKYKGQTQEKQGISFKMGACCFKGSEVDRKFSLAGLEKTLAQQQKQQTEPQERQEQKSGLADNSTKEKGLNETASKNDNSATLEDKEQIQSQDKIKNLTKDIEKAVGKTLDILLNPQHGNEPVPYQLSPRAEEKRKKKKKRNLGL